MKEGRLRGWSRCEAHMCSWHRHWERLVVKGVAWDSAGKSGLCEREMEAMQNSKRAKRRRESENERTAFDHAEGEKNKCQENKDLTS